MHFVTSFFLHVSVVWLVLAGPWLAAPGLVVSRRRAVRGRSSRTGSGETEDPNQPTLEQVDGGPGYGRSSYALTSRASYFPFAVRSQEDVRGHMDAGLNTYVVLTRDINLSLLRRNAHEGHPAAK